jgi:hypothetical protein
VGLRDLGNQGLRAVAASHAKDIGSTLHGTLRTHRVPPEGGPAGGREPIVVAIEIGIGPRAG